MPPDHDQPTIHRIVECNGGTVEMQTELLVRFDYGSIVPWVESTGDGLCMVAGPDGLRLRSGVPLEGHGQAPWPAGCRAGNRRSFSLTWYDSSTQPFIPRQPRSAETDPTLVDRLGGRCTYEG
ncbi:MAG: hypothetical protein R2714_06075 [Microthrixaceae bacterium]